MLAEEHVLTQFVKTVAVITTPERLSATPKKFRKAIFIGNKAWQTPNVGDVFLGCQSGDGTQPIKITTGATFTLEAPEGQQFDFYDLWLDVATAVDGVVVVYS